MIRRKVKNAYLILTIFLALVALMYGLLCEAYVVAIIGFAYLTLVAVANDMED